MRKLEACGYKDRRDVARGRGARTTMQGIATFTFVDLLDATDHADVSVMSMMTSANFRVGASSAVVKS